MPSGAVKVWVTVVAGGRLTTSVMTLVDTSWAFVKGVRRTSRGIENESGWRFMFGMARCCAGKPLAESLRRANVVIVLLDPIEI